MKKFNQRYINRIIFSKLFENENERPIPELGQVLPDGLDPAYNPSIEDWEIPDNESPDRETPNEEGMNEYFKFLEYYRQFQEWYRREYPDDNDPGRLARAWEAMRGEIQRLIDRGYTWHEIRKYFYRNTDGKHNRNYEDFPDWYYQSNEQKYGNNKDNWDIPKRYRQGWR